MPLWTLFGLNRGLATTPWPNKADASMQPGVLGLPQYHPEQCREDCRDCADACLPKAITIADRNLHLDYGKCIGCQLCTEACPSQAMTPSNNWAFGVPKQGRGHGMGLTPSLSEPFLCPRKKHRTAIKSRKYLLGVFRSLVAPPPHDAAVNWLSQPARNS